MASYEAFPEFLHHLEEDCHSLGGSSHESLALILILLNFRSTPALFVICNPVLPHSGVTHWEHFLFLPPLSLTDWKPREGRGHSSLHCIPCALHST